MIFFNEPSLLNVKNYKCLHEKLFPSFQLEFYFLSGQLFFFPTSNTLFMGIRYNACICFDFFEKLCILIDKHRKRNNNTLEKNIERRYKIKI